MRTPSPETIQAVKALQVSQLLRDAFMVCQSSPPSEAFPDAMRFSVTVSFHQLRDAQEFHGVLVEIWKRANEPE